MLIYGIKFILVTVVITAWVFSGFPRIWTHPVFPPRIQTAWAATECIRPSSFTDHTGGNTTWDANGNSYDTSTCPGPDATTSEGYSGYNVNGDDMGHWNWTTGAGQSYTALTLKVNVTTTGYSKNTWGFYYTLDGSDPTSASSALIAFNSNNVTNQTYSVALSAGQNITNVKVALVSSKGTKGGDPNANVEIFDVWTSGEYNSVPSISNMSMNGGNDITLVEGGSVWATTTMTVTDADGCSDISSVSAKFYLASSTTSGTTCGYDGSDCYTASSCTATTTGNTCTGGADTSAEYDCGFQVWYTAEATDGSAPIWSSSIWAVAATSTDASSAEGTDTNTAETTEVNTLLSLDVSSSISYGTVGAGEDTGSTNQTTTITNTGNTAIDFEVSGDSMCTDYPTCAGGTIQPGQQKYSSVTFTYDSGGTALSASPASFEADLVKPTATTTPVTDQLFWGIGIPEAQSLGSYSGENTFTAIGD